MSARQGCAEAAIATLLESELEPRLTAGIRLHQRSDTGSSYWRVCQSSTLVWYVRACVCLHLLLYYMQSRCCGQNNCLITIYRQGVLITLVQHRVEAKVWIYRQAENETPWKNKQVHEYWEGAERNKRQTHKRAEFSFCSLTCWASLAFLKLENTADVWAQIASSYEGCSVS